MTFIFLIGILGLTLIAACDSANTTTAQTSEGFTAASSTSISEAKQNTLTIYSGRSEKLVGPIIDQFAKATGIDVQVKYAKTPQLAATILEEGTKSPADIFFAQDPGGLAAVDSLLMPMSGDTLNQVPEWARSTDAKWVGISGRARTVVYNPNTTLEEELPDSMWGFVEPQWKGRIGWAPTNASFQAMVTAMRAVWGEDRARDWLNAIQVNQPIVYPKNTPQVAAVAAGEIDVGFVNHYYLLRFLAEEGNDFAARNYHPRSGGPGSVIMVAGAGILESSENKTNAAKFLDFMLSKVAQQYFAGQTYEYPLIDGVKTSRILVPFDEINHPGLPLNSFADLEGTGDLLRETGILP